MDEKLKYCEVALEDCRFKLPSSPKKIVNSNIGSRRQSIRLQDKVITSMKECTPRKAKKKIIQRHVDGKAQKSVEPDVVVTAKPDVVVAANDSQNNSNPVQLSDKDILEMLGDFATFIENGAWDPNSEIFTNDEVSGSEAYQYPQSQSDEPLKPTTSSVASVTSDHDYCSSVSQPISHQTSQTQTLLEPKRSTYTETEPLVHYSTTCQTDAVQRRTVSTQTDFDQHSKSTQTCMKIHKSISVQTSFMDNASVSSNTDTDTRRNALKRKNSSDDNDEPSKCQIFIKNLGMTVGSVNSTNYDMDSGKPKSEHAKLQQDKSSSDAKILRQDNNQMEALQPLALQPKPIAQMKIEVVGVLQGPCIKFLKREHCGPHCKYNHFLPSATDLAAAIRNWSSEQVNFLYLTYVQRYKMCHQMYFDVICTAFVEKRSPENVIAMIKDCERLSMESQFIVVLFALKKCGYTDDGALFEIFKNVGRSRNTINEILKVIVTFKLVNFKRTIAFLSSEMGTIDFDPYFGNEILKQAVEIETLDVILINFCCAIVRKYSRTLNAEHMASLLSKI